MGKKLYVGNLSFNATESDISDYFTAVGEVESVRLITDRATGRSKGYGFVEMATDEGAALAIEKYDGQEFLGRALTVNEARPPATSGPRGGGGFGGGGGGGFGGGGRREGGGGFGGGRSGGGGGYGGGDGGGFGGGGGGGRRDRRPR